MCNLLTYIKNNFIKAFISNIGLYLIYIYSIVIKIRFSFRSTEVMFDPTLFNVDCELGGIHNIIFKACGACNIKEQPSMYENIVLSGGNSLYPFLSDRLESMVAKLVSSATKIDISTRPERKFSTWIGGSILASVSTFEQMWINKEEYEEQGPLIVHYKCSD